MMIFLKRRRCARFFFPAGFAEQPVEGEEAAGDVSVRASREAAKVAKPNQITKSLDACTFNFSVCDHKNNTFF
jgi:hypothetical protein